MKDGRNLLPFHQQYSTTIQSAVVVKLSGKQVRANLSTYRPMQLIDIFFKLSHFTILSFICDTIYYSSSSTIHYVWGNMPTSPTSIGFPLGPPKECRPRGWGGTTWGKRIFRRIRGKHDLNGSRLQKVRTCVCCICIVGIKIIAESYEDKIIFPFQTPDPMGKSARRLWRARHTNWVPSGAVGWRHQVKWVAVDFQK